ncbi:MAG: hypothetical protein WCX69_01255 [Candidatus Paceibacterota bacterium]
MLKKILIVFAAIAAVTAGIIFFVSRSSAPAPGNGTQNPTQDAPAQNQTPENQTPPETGNGEAPTPAGDGKNAIDTFEKCVAAGKKVLGEKPNRRCIVDDKIAYIEIESCTAPTGESMSFFDAERLFERSQCSREGSPDKHYCNEGTGTWWIDIVAYRKGCSPACVIDVITKKAEVNWRCTGATEK